MANPGRRLRLVPLRSAQGYLVVAPSGRDAASRLDRLSCSSVATDWVKNLQKEMPLFLPGCTILVARNRNVLRQSSEAIAEGPQDDRPLTVAATTDRELLMRFVRRRDEDALTDLIEKHAAMVLAVCTQILRHRQDAEDAFQATFLILAQRAHKIRRGEAVGGWLYQVAYRTAMRAAKRRQERRAQPIVDFEPASDERWAEITEREEAALLHEELDRLPEKLRAPLVLCFLEGKSQREAAEELACPPRTVKDRVARGKQMLRMRLARRGVMTGAVLAAVASSATACRAEPLMPLVNATAVACGAVLQGNVAALSTTISSLAQEGVTVMKMTSLYRVGATAVLLAGVGVTLSLSVVLNGFAAQGPTSERPAGDVLVAGSYSATADPLADVMVESTLPIGTPISEIDQQSEARITEALSDATTMEFIETPLSDVLDYLAELHGIQIYLDERALSEVGVANDTPITMRLSDVSFRSGLNLMLRRLDEQVVWTIRDGVLMITTPSEAMTTKVYDVGDIVQMIEVSEEAVAPDFDSLIGLITGTIHPTSWDEIGGPGTVGAFEGADVNALVVSASTETHLEIERLLSDIRRLRAAVARMNTTEELPVGGGRCATTEWSRGRGYGRGRLDRSLAGR